MADRRCICAQLKVKVVKALAAREQQARRRNLTKYIPNAAQAIFTVSVASDTRLLTFAARPSVCGSSRLCDCWQLHFAQQ